MQVTTRVFLVWAYNVEDDASDPSSFSMHSRKSHSREFHRLVFETFPTASTEDNPSILNPNTPALGTLRPAKANGFQLKFNMLVISLATFLSVVV